MSIVPRQEIEDRQTFSVQRSSSPDDYDAGEEGRDACHVFDGVSGLAYSLWIEFAGEEEFGKLQLEAEAQNP